MSTLALHSINLSLKATPKNCRKSTVKIKKDPCKNVKINLTVPHNLPPGIKK